MNAEFALAAIFGLGLAGLLAQLSRQPVTALYSRVVRNPNAVHPQSNEGISQKLNFLIHSFTKPKSDSRTKRALFELPEIMDLLVVALRSGEGIYRCFALIVPRCDGELAKELSKVLLAVNYGASFGVEIRALAKALPSAQVNEFVNKVALSLERGTPLAAMLSEQSKSARAEIRNRLLQQAGRNETRMLIPLVFLILPVTVLFAIYPSLELLNFSFI